MTPTAILWIAAAVGAVAVLVIVLLVRGQLAARDPWDMDESSPS